MTPLHRIPVCSGLILTVLTLGMISANGQNDKQRKPDRLLRVLPLGEAPPFKQKIIDGVRQEQAAPEGSIPPREVIQMSTKGEEIGVPLRLQLDRLSVSMPVAPGPMSLHENAAKAKAWHKLTVPAKSRHALALLWRDPAVNKWSKARSMTLADDTVYFPAGFVRFVNVSPWPAIIQFKGKDYQVAPYKSARLQAGILKQVPVKVFVQDKNGKKAVAFNSSLSQNALERTNLIVYRADGSKPRRPAKVHILREPARLPVPPRPREG